MRLLCGVVVSVVHVSYESSMSRWHSALAHIRVAAVDCPHIGVVFPIFFAKKKKKKKLNMQI